MTDKYTVYLAGRMRGVMDYNFPAFRRVAAVLRDMGYEVISPAEHDEEQGFDPTGMSGWEDLSEVGFDLNESLAWDLNAVCTKADAVVVFGDYHRSKGVAAEIATAIALGKPVLELHNVSTWTPTGLGRTHILKERN